jgi:hypothetical protein
MPCATWTVAEECMRFGVVDLGKDEERAGVGWVKLVYVTKAAHIHLELTFSSCNFQAIVLVMLEPRFQDIT